MKVTDKVLLTDKVLVRTKDDQGKQKNLTKVLVDEPGEVAKLDKQHVYVKTQYGVHYVHESKLKPAV